MRNCILPYPPDQPAKPPPASFELAALYFTETLGAPVFPCEPAGKRPLGALAPHGVKDATTDPRVIRAWWGACPGANIGLATGGGFFALDVDGDEGKASLAKLQEHHGPLPPTVASVTGSGGWHLFYGLPHGRAIRNSAGKLGPKLDVRGAGGYVVAPPSAHPSGRPYTFMPGCEPWSMPLAMAPAWLLGLLDRPVVGQPARIAPRPAAVVRDGSSAYARTAFERELVHVAGAPEGQRNHTLNRAAFSLGQLVGAGCLARGFVKSALDSVARAAGLPPKEVEATIESGLEAGMASPREVRHA